MASKAAVVKPSAFTQVFNHFRPHRGEAVIRLRSNTFGLISIFISTWLLPIPSVISAFRLFSSKKALPYLGVEDQNAWNFDRIVCTLELAIVIILAYNVLEAFYALKYPRKSFPPPSHSPVKKPSPVGVFSPSPAKKPFRIISPSSTPTSKSKLFAYSPGQSLSSSQARSPQYPPSPVTLPSHVIRYSMPPKPSAAEAGGIGSSISSSASTMPPTPSPTSPVASAYRGQHASSFGGGRPIDGLFLSQIASREEEDEE
ncbi:hypothetical protein D9757_003063 [Collybiopsis confluens]|uniref:Uncharacterized protein n=1 Tax=Collybiopsis confluens TaxID=2823264 RepID=A0A8H5MEJ4_9AGAR|nr:hypothetical protein D9757_003063 [Collybiopsis confluens]